MSKANNNAGLGKLEKLINLVFEQKISQLISLRGEQRRQFIADTLAKVQNSKEVKKINEMIKAANALKQKLSEQGFNAGPIWTSSRVSILEDHWNSVTGTYKKNKLTVKWDNDHKIDRQALEIKKMEIIAQLYGNEADFKTIMDEINKVFKGLGI